MLKLIAMLAALTAAAACASAAQAHDYTAGTIKIGHPWARAAPKGARVGGAYMTLTNTGTQSDRLIGGSAAVSAKFELHEMKMDGGVMRMRALAKGLEIKPGETVALKPDSFHAMLIDLRQPLVEGEKVKGTLAFERAGVVEIEFAVEAVGAGSEGHGGMHHGK